MFKKATGKGISIPVGIGIGVLLCVAVTMAGAALVAYLLSTEKMAVTGIGWAAIVLLVLASFTGSVVAAGIVKVNRLPVCLGVGAGYILMLLGCTALFFGGQYQGIPAAAVSVLVGSAGAGLLGFKGKKNFTRRRKIPAYR